MKWFKKIILGLSVFVFSGYNVSGQDSLKVFMQVNPGKESIKLRWAVDCSYSWKKSLKFGYTIERYTVKRNGVLLPESEKEKKILSQVRTAPFDAWEQIARQNNYAAVLAQAIYGDTFEVTGLESSNMVNVVNLSDELDQRYTFAMSSADMCFDCACLAGWGYEDKEVSKGEYYLYRVIPTGEGVEAWNVQYGFAYTGIEDYKELPKPVYVSAEFGDQMVRLHWDVSLFKRIFCTWQVEKSEDNLHFTPLGIPSTSWNESEREMMLVDSLAANNKTFYYRVRGLSIFGDTSEPSEVVSGKGVETMKSTPAVTRSIINEQGAVEISWEFDEAAQHLVESFELQQSPSSATGTYKSVMKSIPANQRSLTYSGALDPSNYFLITALPFTGKPASSFPVLLMPVDSFPPQAPQKIIARADTSGHIFLEWVANTESDLLGYKLFRGHVKGEELIPLVNDFLSGTQYTDSVNLKNLNTHVYYAVKAVDKRFNQSSFSEILEVEKPLKIKPSPPVISDYKVESNGIFIRWINSPGSEVAQHTLYRAKADSLKFLPVTVIKQDSITSFRDTEVEGGVSYIYRVTASSRWNIESDPSPVLQVTASPRSNPIALKQLKSSVDQTSHQIKLSWKPVDIQNVKMWKVYRSENDEPITFWKDIPAENLFIEDTNSLKAGNRYHYLVYAVMRDGGNSLPEKIMVTY